VVEQRRATLVVQAREIVRADDDLPARDAVAGGRVAEVADVEALRPVERDRAGIVAGASCARQSFALRAWSLD
jgi:hypothetical protein